MKAEEIERLRKEKQAAPGLKTTTAAEAHAAARPPTPALPIAPFVVPSREGASEADRLVTQQLLNASKQGDIYQCQRCTFSTPDPEAMIDHIAEEINQAMLRIGNLPASDPNMPAPPGSRGPSDIKPQSEGS